MKIAITLLLYALAYGWGWRKLRGEGHRRRRVLLGCIMGYGVYLNLCGITDTPHISLGLLYTAYFQPVGRAVIHWLGG